MIKTSLYTPEYYNINSRDFQLFGYLYDSIFNYAKTNASMIYNIPLSKDVDRSILDLTIRTLGFEPRHEYNLNTLYALCWSFKDITKVKGTKKAVEMLIQMLLKAQNYYLSEKDNETYSVDIHPNLSEIKIGNNAEYTVNIKIPDRLRDRILIDDMLDYILPAGFTYSINLVSSIQAKQVEEKYKFNAKISSIEKYDVTKFDFENNTEDTTTEKKKGIILNPTLNNQSTSMILGNLTNSQVLPVEVNNQNKGGN